MKKSILFLTVLLLYFADAQSQSINYKKSLAEAEKLSAQQNKPLCILVIMQPPSFVKGLLAGLEDPEIVSKFNENFINYKIDRSDTASAAIIRKYKLSGFPAFVFVDSKGGMIFKKFGNMPPPILSNMIGDAIATSKGKSLTDYDKQYASGDLSTLFLKDYINKRITAGITDNADLIEHYVNNLQVSDLNNYGEALFILKAGPLADGRAYTLVNTNRKLVDSIFKTELYDVRVAINNRTIANTMANAIANKNFNRALAASNYTQGTWNGIDRIQGFKNGSLKVLQYYAGIKDTANFMNSAVRHYDQFYMNVSIDSIRKLDKKNEEMVRSNANEQATLSTPAGANIRSVSYAFMANTFSTDLNNGAYSIYMTGTKNLTTLSKAMLWSKRSIELNPVAAYYDTLSHILYRLGFYAEAEATQEKAVNLAKVEKRSVTEMQNELTKIKSRSL